MQYKGISVIIPVFNNAQRLEKALDALCRQEYPDSLYEIIVIDNGSDDGSPDIAQSFGNVTCLKETDYPNSPYSARNRGIEAANFEIVAFLDATCVPDRHWLSEAATCFPDKGADLVSGKTVFETSDKPDAGEIHDVLFNVNARDAAKKGWAPCANLFVKKSLFEKYGKFEEGARSGEDYRLTRALTAGGGRLVYNDMARVFKPARNTRQVIAKQKRVARGQVGIWKKEGRVFSYLAKAIFRAVVPPNPAAVYRAIRLRGQPWMYKKFVKIYVFRYYILILMTLENLKILLGTTDKK
ncbi:MAG: glycosyltransferase [Desulfosalsimonas sp.]